MNIIEVDQVTKAFSNHLALDHVSLSVPEGVVFGLLGPNGAGKTTLIRILNQITFPDSGTVYFKGHPLEADDVRQIGYLPEERGLYKKMKAGEQAMYLARLKGLDRNTAYQSSSSSTASSTGGTVRWKNSRKACNRNCNSSRPSCTSLPSSFWMSLSAVLIRLIPICWKKKFCNWRKRVPLSSFLPIIWLLWRRSVMRSHL